MSNLAGQRIKDTYDGVLHADGSSLTLGDGTSTNAIDADFNTVNVSAGGLKEGGVSHTSVSATTSVAGHVELATDAEAHAATDTTRAVTPSNLLIKKDGGLAIIAGALYGNSRGYNALDVQSSHSSPLQVASGFKSSAVGRNNTASSTNSSAFGYKNTASGYNSSAFGCRNIASSFQSSAFGYFNTASGYNSSAVGKSNTASQSNSIAVGYSNTASGGSSSAVGSDNTASGVNCSSVGRSNTATGNFSSAVGWGNEADGLGFSAVGYNNTASGSYGSSAVGYFNTASGDFSTTVGSLNQASGGGSAVGYSNEAIGDFSSSFGYNNTASGYRSNAFGYSNVASGSRSSAFGYRVKTTVNNTFEAGYWSNSSTRGGAIRMHPNGQVAMTIEDSPSIPNDGGATAGGEADGSLPRGMFAIQKNGTAVTLYYNNGGSIESLSLGTLS